MIWSDVSEPGYTIHTAQVEGREYRVQSKADLGVWRLFIRVHEKQPLRTIFTGPDLASCMDYASVYEESFK